MEYKDLVAALAKPGKDIVERMTPWTAHLWHMATGVSGEAGELLDAIKKFAVYGKVLDRENVIEELGDLEFYMEGIRATLNVSREEVLLANKAKLLRRYSGGVYSDAQAIARADKEGA